MKKFNSFFLGLIFILLLASCSSRKGPPAPVSYGRSSPESVNASAPIPVPSPSQELSPQTLKPKTVIVEENETLVMFAQRTNTPAYQIITLNDLKKPYTLKPGQSLRLTEDAPILPSMNEGKKDLSEEEPSLDESQEDEELSPPVAPTPKPKRKLTEAEKELLTSLQQEKNALSLEKEKKENPSIPPAADEKEDLKVSKKNVPLLEEPSSSTSSDQDQEQPQEEKSLSKEKVLSEAPNFIWPVTGKIISRFGPGEGTLQNDGINIAAPKGTPIVAIENGVVVYAGNEMQGFGNLILVKHPGGWMSSYGHAAKIMTERGAKIQKGQTIALVGNTGSVHDPQLHFELRNMKKSGKVVNPELYLK